MTYGSRLARLLTTNGPYDVVHSHVHFSSGFVLREAARLAIPNRIAHSHNDTRSLDQQSGWLRRLYRRTTSGWIHRYATTGLACSSWAAAALFGENWKADDRWKILRYGVDFSKFSQSRHRELFLQELGIPANRKIIGQIGRLAEQKNHRFSVQVLRELVAKGADAQLLIVGGGELEHLIRMQIQEAGLSERATMVGDQQDVASYLSVMDLMIFPSVHEGLGIVMLEAQAAGVPVVASDHVPGDGIVLPDLVEQLSLQAGMAAWADAIQDKMNAPTKDPAKTVALMSQSDFAISSSVERYAGYIAATTIRTRRSGQRPWSGVSQIYRILQASRIEMASITSTPTFLPPLVNDPASMQLKADAGQLPGQQDLMHSRRFWPGQFARSLSFGLCVNQQLARIGSSSRCFSVV